MMAVILLVEDDLAISTHLMEILRNEGYQVLYASGQKDALFFLGQEKIEKIDLALVDVTLPDGNGFSLLTEIHSQINIPIIFLTASGDESSVVTGLNLGAVDYIIKPFRPREFLARIVAALRKNQVEILFTIGDLVVDMASGIVKKNGVECFLTAVEYRLLLIFINHPLQILSRAQLLDALWDAAGEFVNDNTLTVYIKRLREKIETDPSRPQIILTVRGMGYRLGDAHVSQ